MFVFFPPYSSILPLLAVTLNEHQSKNLIPLLPALGLT